MFNMAAFKKAVFIGVVGTVMMTVYSFVADYFHLPQGDYHGLIARLFHASVLGTWAVYFAAGVAFAYCYRAFFHDRLPAHSWMRGLFFGMGLWMFMGLVLMPYMGMGFFAGSMTTAVGLFMGMAFYGGTVGYMYDR